MRHGYTNSTERVGSPVRKRYQGPDGERRQATETAVLRALAGRFPVPDVVGSDAEGLVLGFVPGAPGQEQLEQDPGGVLTEVGRVARVLHALDLTESDLAGSDLPGTGPLVHGDFGPQNMIIDAGTGRVAAVVDWELTHRGDPVEDLAWPEWIVRTHHPHLAYALPSLFAGYGEEPAWAKRHAAMLAKCRWAIAFATRWSGPDAPGVRLWRDRLTATAAFAP